MAGRAIQRVDSGGSERRSAAGGRPHLPCLPPGLQALLSRSLCP